MGVVYRHLFCVDVQTLNVNSWPGLQTSALCGCTDPQCKHWAWSTNMFCVGEQTLSVNSWPGLQTYALCGCTDPQCKQWAWSTDICSARMYRPLVYTASLVYRCLFCVGVQTLSVNSWPGLQTYALCGCTDPQCKQWALSTDICSVWVYRLSV